MAGENVQPLEFVVNDRKMGCADHAVLRVGDVIELVGHPHGKPRVLHQRTLAKMLPSSIAPLRIQFDRETETGTAGCAVFTRGGRLLGMQHFTSLKDAAPSGVLLHSTDPAGCTRPYQYVYLAVCSVLERGD
ncbi:hypothetical protein PINS_up016775 [Pythium insidiosum]|nr:hypothetical protein PINS_up016775 [Pythium insidiosum]